MTQAPWFYGIEGPTLAHQRNAQEMELTSLPEDKDKVVSLGQAKRFVAGACQNCGSKTHKTQQCVYAKKKVGAKYSGKVTGHDLELKKAEANTENTAGTIFGLKRDRFSGEIGVNLLRRGDLEKLTPGTTEDKEEEHTKKFKPVDVFNHSTAQHGGVEIHSVPKYLQNLDDALGGNEGVFFDPKTGAMLGNPNAHDPTKLFQGDLERYRSGDFYNFVEGQHRFLTGQSKSYVDFEFDAKMRDEKIGLTKPTGEGKNKEEKNLTTEEVLVQSLYGKPADKSGATEKAEGVPFVKMVPVNETANSRDVQRFRATFNGHKYPFGSYFSKETFSWGYKCCMQTGRDAPCKN
ncbi:pre-mRNA-processing factor SLU7 [Angomonas deanei]|nr:pre-mRNA-processing factor SLU7 [Angomonas deanei]|eukprot:EPY36690.1 pre-mRNA-processing factor SLU7 [Angomonas deanei]